MARVILDSDRKPRRTCGPGPPQRAAPTVYVIGGVVLTVVGAALCGRPGSRHRRFANRAVTDEGVRQ